MKKEYVRKSFYLPKNIVTWLDKKAKNEGRSSSNALVNILKELIETVK